MFEKLVIFGVIVVLIAALVAIGYGEIVYAERQRKEKDQC